jgi:hypothetical protein
MGKEKVHISLVVIGHVDAGECQYSRRSRRVSAAAGSAAAAFCYGHFRLHRGVSCKRLHSVMDHQFAVCMEYGLKQHSLKLTSLVVAPSDAL